MEIGCDELRLNLSFLDAEKRAQCLDSFVGDAIVTHACECFREFRGSPTRNHGNVLGHLRPPGGEHRAAREKEAEVAQILPLSFGTDVFPEALAKAQSDADDFAHGEFFE